jgi:DNA-binding HxlR family transcriptional regulator
MPLTDKHCTAAELFQTLSGKWTLPVLYQLHKEGKPMRFGELRKSVGSITTSELTKSLRHLEALGLILRVQYNEIPLHVEYSCTDLGKSLRGPLEELGNWLTAHRAEMLQAQAGANEG